MDNRVTDSEQHPDPSRYWRHRRRLAYTAMACLIVTLAVALFGDVRSPELVQGLAWGIRNHSDRVLRQQRNRGIQQGAEMNRILQFLVGLLSGKSGGIILGAVAAMVSALVAYAGWQSWRVHSLRADLAAAVAEHAQCESQKAVALANASRLADAIEQQNRKIAELQQQADAVAAADAMKAERVLRDGQVRQQQIHDSDGVGPEVMNTWFADRL